MHNKPKFQNLQTAKGGLPGKYIELINNDNASLLPPHIYKKWEKGGLLAFGVKPERPTSDLTHRCEWTFTGQKGYGPKAGSARYTCAHGWVILGYEWKRATRYQGPHDTAWARTTPLPLFIGKTAQKVGHSIGPNAAYVNGLQADQPCDALGNPAGPHAGSGPPGPWGPGGKYWSGGLSMSAAIPDSDPELEALLQEEEYIEAQMNASAFCYICGEIAYQKGASSGLPLCSVHVAGKSTKPIGASDPATYNPGDSYHTCPTWHKQKYPNGTYAMCVAHSSLISWSEFITGKKADAKLNKLLATAAKTGPTKASLLAKYQAEIPAPTTPMSKQGQMLHAGDAVGANGNYVVTEEGEGYVGNPNFIYYGVDAPKDAPTIYGYFKSDEGEALAIYDSATSPHWIPTGVAPDGKQVWSPDYYLFGKGWIKMAGGTPKPKHPPLPQDDNVTCYALTSENEVVPWYAGVGALGSAYHLHSKHGKYLLYAHKDSYVNQQEPPF